MPHRPDCQQPIPRGYLDGAPAVWLLTIEIAGRTLRYASQAVDVASRAEGKAWSFRGALPGLQVDQALDVLSQTPEAPSVSLDLVVEEPIAQWVRWGHRLDQSTAELSWWVRGTLWEQRQVIASGTLRDAYYGALGEPLGFVLEPQLKGEGRPILDPRGVITADTAGGLYLESEEGTPYPKVFGSPGIVEPRSYLSGGARVTITRKLPGTAAPIWNVDGSGLVTQVLMCDGHGAVAGSVVVFFEGTDGGTDDGDAVLNGSAMQFVRDGLDRPITLLNVSSLTAGQRTARRWAICWDEAASGEKVSGGPPTRYRRVFTAAGGSVVENVAPFQVGDVVQERRVEVTTAFDGGAPTLDLNDSNNPASTEFRVAEDLKTVGVYSDTDTVSIGLNGFIEGDIDISGSTVGSATVSVWVQQVTTGRGAIRTIGDLITWLVDRSTVRLARPEWYSIAARLTMPVSGAITDRDEHYWPLLRDTVLPLCPISLRHDVRGVAPVYWDWQAGPDDALARLVVGLNGVVRLPDVRAARPDDEINTQARFQYGWDPLQGRYRAERWLQAEPAPQDETWRTMWGDAGTGNASLAAQFYGQGRTLTLESKIVYDQITADWVMRHRLAAEGWAHRVVELECDQVHGFLMPGDVVTLTDAAVSMVDAVALVQGRRLTDHGRIGLRLLLVEGYTSVSTGPTADAGWKDRPGSATPQ